MALINLDWDNILKKDGWTPDASGDELVKSMPITPMQLGMFDWAEIKVTKSQVFTVTLYCDKYAPNKATMDFMAHCYYKWGNDSFARGLPCQDDVTHLKNGTFIRSWDNVVMYQTKRPGKFGLTVAINLIFSDADDMGDIINAPFFKHEVAANSTPEQNAPSQSAGKCVVLNKPLTTLQIILCIALSLFLAPLGTIGVFVYGLLRYVDKSAKVRWVSNQSGTAMRESTIPASPEVIAINKRNGKTAIIISLACAVIAVLSIVTDPELAKSLTIF